MIPSWLIIGGVTLVVALAGRVVRSSDASWFYNLQTPEWLTFEWAISLIWTTIFICGAWSAYRTHLTSSRRGCKPLEH